jgi:hypothetical protein|tara:strand:- start:328 stop:546 length:219 start_codon:yes stop_codon:yes gene_type:complete
MYASYSQQKLAPAKLQAAPLQKGITRDKSNLTTAHQTGAGKRPAKKNKFKLDLDTVKAPGKVKAPPLKHVQS